MHLRPLETDDLETVAGWMALEENSQWLDFGGGRQVLTAASLALMRQRDLHCLRLFTSDEGDPPIGIVALSNLIESFKSGTLWYVLGNKRYSGHGYTSRAVSDMLSIGFGQLKLESVNAWAVAKNTASVRVLEKNGFSLIGRQRRCHLIGRQLQDRLLFDLLSEEHEKHGR
jgi:RimJ/RimL family protein N-acetyltransferase